MTPEPAPCGALSLHGGIRSFDGDGVGLARLVDWMVGDARFRGCMRILRSSDLITSPPINHSIGIIGPVRGKQINIQVIANVAILKYETKQTAQMWMCPQ